MKKSPLFLSCCVFFSSLALPVVTSAAVDEGLLEARQASFTGEGAAVRFHNLQSLFFTEEVKKGRKTWKLPYNKKVDLSKLRYEYQGKEYGVREFMASNRGNALLVIKEGAIVAEMYLNGSDENSRFMSFSTGKSFTSTLLGMAVEDGYIKSLDEPVTNYMPKLKGSGYDGASIRDVMQMSSGVNLNEDYTLDPQGAKIFADGVNKTWFAGEMRFSDFSATLKRKHQPGTVFNYNTFDTFVLGKLVENAVGMRFHKYLEKRLWQPMGMESDMTMIMDSDAQDRESMSGGGYMITLRDFGRFGQMMLNKGQANGKQQISSDWVEEATHADPDKPFLHVGAIDDSGIKVGYQHQWWLFPNGEFSAEGVFGQFVYVMPKENLVIVKLSYWKDAWENAKAEEALAFFHAVADYLK